MYNKYEQKITGFKIITVTPHTVLFDVPEVSLNIHK